MTIEGMGGRSAERAWGEHCLGLNTSIIHKNEGESIGMVVPKSTQTRRVLENDIPTRCTLHHFQCNIISI